MGSQTTRTSNSSGSDAGIAVDNKAHDVGADEMRHAQRRGHRMHFVVDDYGSDGVFRCRFECSSCDAVIRIEAEVDKPDTAMIVSEPNDDLARPCWDIDEEEL
jgi:hypothetical protein